MKRFSFDPFSKRRIPIAWLLLKKQPTKLLVAVLGVAFASILILMQLAIQDALYNSSVAIFNKFNTDLVVLNPQSASLTGIAGFPESRLADVYADKSVDDIYPVRWRYVKWRLPGDDMSRWSIGIGINPSQPVFNDPAVKEQQGKLTVESRVLYDVLSRPEFGPVKELFNSGKTVNAFVNDHRLRVAGLVRLGPSFGYDASFITNINTINAIFPPKEERIIELGLVKLRPGADPVQTASRIRKSLSPDVTIMTRDDLVSTEKSYWSTSKPIGTVFAFCAVMGLSVGSMMVYQLLSMDVTFHLPAYALMMSIGYRRLRLERIVFNEGLILSVLGFPVAWLVSSILCMLITANTSLPMDLPLKTVVATFLLIVSMCCASSLFAMSKLNDADPSELFG
ncbi:ABC transporter permease DevC [Synechococcus sp. CBW1004]|jgi:putative ABC transport system permease protein|uniref:ABC transporter permease DevC n=1 Tax=Synechococcus sp. CBW1004 TaxID=1353136 RepID=UPI0018CD5150|nr:ABC transporter permease DevC [Synechococcus sp. CBW1004]QPN62075.1 FtsX-like permease family protein [Synechococcus sp. CBW1004]